MHQRRAWVGALWVVVISSAAHAQEAAPVTPAPQAAPVTQASPPVTQAAPVTQAPPPAPQAPPPSYPSLADQAFALEPEWYGYQILLMDIVAITGGVLVGTANDGSDAQARGDSIASAWGFGMVGTLTVHSLHENGILGLAGLGARMLLPPIGAVLGVGFHCIGVGGDDPCSADGGTWGFASGMALASVIDIALLANEHRSQLLRASQHDWYGWQMLIIDGAALATGVGVALGQAHDDRTLNGGALLVMPWLIGMAASPWVHAFHGRIGLAFASLGLRALVPAFGAVAGIAGYCAASGTEMRCTKEGAIWGIFGGTLVVAAFDIGVLAYERVPQAQAQATSVMPYIVPNDSGVSAGLSGTF